MVQDQLYNKMVFFLFAGLLDLYIFIGGSMLQFNFGLFIFGFLIWIILASGVFYILMNANRSFMNNYRIKEEDLKVI